MDKNDLYKLTDEALLEQKKKMMKSKLWYSLSIGFLSGILIFGVVSWLLSSEKRFGILFPILIPVFLIYKLVKTPNNNKELEAVLKERNLL